jgi:RNA polymerase sigma-70 factor (ECF subfamily)
MALMSRVLRTPPLLVAVSDDGAASHRGAPALASPVVSTFDELYAAHARYVARLAGRLLGRDDEVADVVQDVFLIAHRRIGSLRKPTAARAWLGRIAVREASRRLRWRRVHCFLRPGAIVDCDLIVDARAAPEMRPLAALLYTALDRIPTRERLAWILRYLVDEPLDTVAEICGCSIATAKRRIGAADRHVGPLLDDKPESAPIEAGAEEKDP